MNRFKLITLSIAFLCILPSVINIKACGSRIAKEGMIELSQALVSVAPQIQAGLTGAGSESALILSNALTQMTPEISNALLNAGNTAGYASTALALAKAEALLSWIDLKAVAAKGVAVIILSNPITQVVIGVTVVGYTGVKVCYYYNAMKREYVETKKLDLELAKNALQLKETQIQIAQKDVVLAKEQTVVAKEQGVLAQEQTVLAKRQATQAHEEANRAEYQRHLIKKNAQLKVAQMAQAKSPQEALHVLKKQPAFAMAAL